MGLPGFVVYDNEPRAVGRKEHLVEEKGRRLQQPRVAAPQNCSRPPLGALWHDATS
jgi:hypothetical protein